MYIHYIWWTGNVQLRCSSKSLSEWQFVSPLVSLWDFYWFTPKAHNLNWEFKWIVLYTVHQSSLLITSNEHHRTVIWLFKDIEQSNTAKHPAIGLCSRLPPLQPLALSAVRAFWFPSNPLYPQHAIQFFMDQTFHLVHCDFKRDKYWYKN